MGGPGCARSNPFFPRRPMHPTVAVPHSRSKRTRARSGSIGSTLREPESWQHVRSKPQAPISALPIFQPSRRLHSAPDPLLHASLVQPARVHSLVPLSCALCCSHDRRLIQLGIHTRVLLPLPWRQWSELRRSVVGSETMASQVLGDKPGRSAHLSDSMDDQGS